MTDILIQDKQHVRVIQLNRPEKLNAISVSMYQELTRALLEGESNSDIHVFLLQGLPESFTTGHDLNAFIAPEDDHASQPLGEDHPTVQFIMALIELRKPLIAAVSGHAIGIGATLLLHCDLVLAADNAAFQMPFVQLNLVPEAGVSYLLPRLCGLQKAAEILLLGEMVYAEEAQAIGLVNHIYYLENLHQKAFLMAARMAAQPVPFVVGNQALLKASRNLPHLKAQMDTEMKMFATHVKMDETKVRMKAFLER